MCGMVAEPHDAEAATLEAEKARQARARRDAALTPAERLARVHELCRQLSSIRPASESER
jgi:hypothetical protein